MKTLDHFQQHFSQYIYEDHAETPLKAFIHHKDTSELKARLSIYKNNIFSAQIESLKNIFPTINELVGDMFFSTMCAHYFLKHPNNDRTMLYLGENFDSFIAHYAPAKSLPYLADIAKLEWLEHEAFHAKNIDPLQVDELQQYAGSALASAEIMLHPSIRLLTSNYAVWHCRNVSNGETIENFDINQIEHILIYRPELNVNSHPVSPDFLAFLEQLLNKKTLAEALETSMEQHSSFNPTQAVNKLVQYALITEIRL